MEKQKNSITIYTLGYEGLQIDEYIQKLKDEKIKILIDVRKNPISRKNGFSKTKFSKILKENGIEYFHFPKLGIESSLRKSLNIKNPETYKELFHYYDNVIIPSAKDSINSIETLAKENNKIALTCFENNSYYCHRSRITNRIKNNKSLYPVIQHI
jgi:uncharacterized protein (DUF488 family)